MATTAGPGDPQALDSVDRVSDRPDFLVLGYPWINAMQPAVDSMITYCSLIPTTPAADCQRFDTLYTPLRFVTHNTPPAFLFATSDDAVVPVSATQQMYDALQRSGVAAELHIFRHGAHGSGLGKGDATLGVWPMLLENWLRDQGWLTPDREIVEENARKTAARKQGEPLSIESRVQDILSDPVGRAVLERHLGANFAAAFKPAQLLSCLRCVASTIPALLNEETLDAIDHDLAMIR